MGRSRNIIFSFFSPAGGAETNQENKKTNKTQQEEYL